MAITIPDVPVVRYFSGTAVVGAGVTITTYFPAGSPSGNGTRPSAAAAVNTRGAGRSSVTTVTSTPTAGRPSRVTVPVSPAAAGFAPTFDTGSFGASFFSPFNRPRTSSITS